MGYLDFSSHTLLFLAALCIGAGLLAWLIYREGQKFHLQTDQWLTEQQERDKARFGATEEDLREWLMKLELPRLEEETKLREAAHQLSIR